MKLRGDGMTALSLFTGGTYIDATEFSHVAVIWGSHLETSQGRVELPFGQNVLDVSLAADGIRFAGKGHDGPVKDQAVEWLGAVPWRVRGPAHGSRACIYDARDDLVIATYSPDPNGLGTEGWRYLNDAGALVPGNQSLVAVPDGRGIWEYIEHGGITIGQGGKGPHGEDPVIAMHGGKRYVLYDGQNYNIKFRLYGDLIVAAWWAVHLKSSALLRIHVADLAQFPEQQFEPIIIPPDPPIDPPIDPPDPPIDPPDPPDPEQPDMDTVLVAIKGPGGKYARADEPNTGPWGHIGAGWRGIKWDREKPSIECQFEMSKPDDRFKLVHVETRGLFGIDATKYSGDIGQQFYLKPDEQDRGSYESPVIYEGNLVGVLQGVVEYEDGGYYSCAFAVEVLP
jgi:hypothetical protein